MNLRMGIIAGIVAGLIGAAVWAGIAYATGYEIGWIAWGIGLMVGAAVAGGSGGDGGPVAISVAVFITILSICGGKYASVYLMVNKMGDEMMLDRSDITDHDIKAQLADEEAMSRMEQGMTIEWPNGGNFDDAYEVRDYPKDIWKVATQRWDGMQRSEREELRGDILADMNEMMASNDAVKDLLVSEGFKHSFGFMDIVFFLLAIFTAGKVAGSEGE